MHVPHPREGYQAGDSGSEGVACAWVQVPAAGPEAAGEAGCRAAEVWRRHHGERLLLAWAQGGHKGCRYATRPKTNEEFWEEKIARNRHRDEVTEAHLEALGWTVITIWECELRGGAAQARLEALADEIRRAGELRREREASKRQSRLEARRERDAMLERQAALEAEIDALYPIPKRIRKASKE